jgi:conjugal transfer pilus assembly protein TraA
MILALHRQAARVRATDPSVALMGLMLALVAVQAMAGTDVTFSTVVDNLTNWTTGSLGKVFALGSLAVGLAIGVVKQSIMSVVTGVAIALAAAIGPGVLAGIFTAVL